jgi:type 1 glutamine amidotransferase
MSAIAMTRWIPALCALMLLLPSAARGQEDARPVKALLVTGGPFHDYERQKSVLTTGVAARINIEWTIVHEKSNRTNTKIPLYENPDWAKGFDIVLHNECFADVKDAEFVERILKPHREGVPAVLIHCTMHCYRTGNERWFEFCGVRSHEHGPHYAFKVENLAKDHPVMKDFGDAWMTPRGELYHIVKVFDTATPLAHAPRRDNNEPQVCIWTNQYGKGRVFGTTIGHYNETMAEPKFLDVVARGILWAVDRSDTPLKKTDEKTDEEIRKLLGALPARTGAACCGSKEGG